MLLGCGGELFSSGRNSGPASRAEHRCEGHPLSRMKRSHVHIPPEVLVGDVLCRIVCGGWWGVDFVLDGIVGQLLETSTDASEYPLVVYGTVLSRRAKIKEQGLWRMKRTHVHFAPGCR